MDKTGPLLPETLASPFFLPSCAPASPARRPCVAVAAALSLPSSGSSPSCYKVATSFPNLVSFTYASGSKPKGHVCSASSCNPHHHGRRGHAPRLAQAGAPLLIPPPLVAQLDHDEPLPSLFSSPELPWPCAQVSAAAFVLGPS